MEQEFNITNWAQVQNPTTATCLKQVMYNSLDTLLMSGAVASRILGLAVGTILFMLV